MHGTTERYISGQKADAAGFVRILLDDLENRISTQFSRVSSYVQVGKAHSRNRQRGKECGVYASVWFSKCVEGSSNFYQSLNELELAWQPKIAFHPSGNMCPVFPFRTFRHYMSHFLFTKCSKWSYIPLTHYTHISL